jgi:hypothetical protein
MRTTILLLLVTGLICFTGCASNNTTETNSAAVESAQAWLEMIEIGDYAGSWEVAAEYFKSVITKDNWQNTLTGVRTPFGKTLSRKLISQQPMTSLPGAPDGDYVVIQFQTSFENKASAVETITPMLDKDGKWRVAGYYIK